MYHIKNDKRSQTSANLITKGLFVCLTTIPMNMVTVSDIYRATGISRATFYRLFDTPEDVLLYLCHKHRQTLLNFYQTHTFHSLNDLIFSTIKISTQNYELLEVLVKNHRTELINDMFSNSIDYILLNFTDESKIIDNDYTRAMMNAIISSTITTWIKHGRKETHEDMFEYTKSFINDLYSILGNSSNIHII